jgi:Asp-tRNA(Asn)/Glu-tRNA(Gln) amidotransferase C subunit
MSGLTLAQIAEKAKAHKMTPAERRAQRVSLIMGLRSKNSTVTREQVSSTLDAIEGRESTREDDSKKS